MASVTNPRSSEGIPPGADTGKERFVDEQIRRTRRALKLVDLVAGLITLTIGVMTYLLVLSVLEHWVVPGGWSPAARALLFLVLIGGVGWFCWRSFWPLLSKPINAAYAAKTIEQSSPSLKNSLLNFLLLRERRRQISQQVYQAIEQQAAQRLAQVPLDSVIDRSAILKLGYVLVAVVALCALYRVLSPKDPIASAGRLLLPWSNIAVPSRVQILDVQPGDTSVARGEQLSVSAEILGLSQDEPVRIRYSANDQQVVDQEVLITPQEGGLRFEGRLPGRTAVGGSGGVQNDLSYWIEAGDARSASYKVSVFSQPTLVVEKIRYQYPIYTRYVPREVENTGDISAVEGTMVTITAIANQPIESAHIDFDAVGRHDLLMKSEGTTATVSFPLELAEDRRTSRYQSYVLRYTTSEGRKNPSPPKYSIDVQVDYPPEIELLAPEQEILDVALQDEVVIEVEARDPDFAVRNVAILGEVAGERRLKKSLLSLDHSGRFVGQIKVTPEELNLKPGDVLEYWGAAADNRRPEPNLAFTKHQQLRVIGRPDFGEGQPQGDQGEGQDQKGGGQQGESGEQGEDGQAGGAGQGQQQGESQDQQGGENGAGGQGGAGEESETSGGEGSNQQSGAKGEASGEGNAESQGQSSGDSASEGSNESQSEGSSESSDQGQGENSGGGQGKVSPEGDEDGAAFEKISDHFNGNQQPGESQEGQGEAAEQEGSEPEGEGSTGNQDGARQRESGKSDTAQGEQQGQSAEQQAQGEQGQGEQAQGEQDQASDGQQAESQGDQQGTAQQEQQQGKQGSEQSEDGMKGAEGEAAPQEPNKGEQQGEQPGEQQGNDAGGSQGPSGAGENPGEEQGSPNPSGEKKPNEKQTDEAAEAEKNDQEAPMEGQGKRESDSQGAQGGDRAGGGQEGAGQQADEQGTGGAGEHQAAEDGGSQADQQGQGETGSKAGTDQKAGGETGESSGDQAGQGEQEREGGGQQPGGEQSQGGEQPEGEKNSDPSSAGGQPQGGGTGGSSTAPPSAAEAEPGDQANLDYARKQTDLVIDKLEDQLEKQQVDKELLDKLGWTPDELRRFVERWRNLKLQADGNGPQAEDAQRELDNALRSLGLGRKDGPSFKSQTIKDKLRDLQDAYHGRTPMEYQERMRKYVKGTATAQEE